MERPALVPKSHSGKASVDRHAPVKTLESAVLSSARRQLPHGNSQGGRMTTSLAASTRRCSVRRREAIALIAVLILGSLAPQSAQAQPSEQSFQFGLIGDMPYANAQEQEFQRVVLALNAADLAFV